MRIEPFFDERTSTLTYVVFDEATRDAVIIDAVLDYEPASGKVWTESVERVAAFVEARNLKVHLLLETHAHADHLSGSQWLKSRLGAPVAVSHRISEVQEIFKGVFSWPDFPADGRQFDRLLKDDEVIQAGTLELKAIPTPGHTPACMSYQAGDAVFTGDALFLDDVGVGRCDFPRGDAGTLYDSVTRRLFTLPNRRGSSWATTTLRPLVPGRRQPPWARPGGATCSSTLPPRERTSSHGAPPGIARCPRPGCCTQRSR